MKTTLNTLIVFGIITLLSSCSTAKKVVPAAPPPPSLQAEVDRLKELKPKQLAEEQKALHKAMQEMTPEQRADQREVIIKELDTMSPEERQALHDKRQSEAEKALAKELAEHGGEIPQESNVDTPEQPASQPTEQPVLQPNEP